MANSITLAQAYQNVVDFKLKKDPVTAGLVKSDEFATALGQNGQVSLMEVSTTGFGDYSRTTGYSGGDGNVTWRAYQLGYERSKKLVMDRMDNAQTRDLAFAALVEEFTSQYAVPEIDAIRFSRMFSRAGTVATPADLTASTALQAYDEAEQAMNEANVPEEGRVLYVSNEFYKFLKQNNLVSRSISPDKATGNIDRGVMTLDNGVPVRKVPKARFYTQITLNPGSSTWGYTKTASTGRDMNFVLVHEPSVMAVVALNKMKIVTADENQSIDQDQYMIRMFHDLIVPEQKKLAIYVHHKTT